MMDFFSKCIVGCLVTLAVGPLCAEILVPVDAEWKYLDDGSDLGFHWTQRDFNDGNWAQGPAPLGYGGRGELTAIGYGPDSNNKYITTYFRRSFAVTDTRLYTHLRATLLCDDGAIVYLNGIEILRENMPQGPIDFKTLAAGRATGNTVIQDLINANHLVAGQNTLAAEVHQWRPGSSDMRFELALAGAERPTDQEPEPVTIERVTPAAGPVEALPEVTVTFNRSVWGVDASDLLANGLAASAVRGGEAVYTFTLPFMGEGTIRMAWAGEHGIVGSGSPPVPFDAYTPPAVWSYALVDPVAPRATTLAPAAGATLSFLDEICIAFSEPVGGVDASDLLLAGTPARSVRGSGAGPYCFTFDAQPAGTLPLRWASDHGIHDFSAAAHPLLSDTWYYHVLAQSGDPDRVVINEIMYHPASERTDEEYIELLNIGTRDVDLTGWHLKRGVDFTFPSMILAPGAFLVVAADVAAFAQRYPMVTPVVGGWEGRLSNSGETLVLEDAAGDVVDLVRYADEGDWALRRRGPNDRGHRGWEWFSAADGGGCSLELCNPLLTNDRGQNWADSLIEGGTPGQENTCARPDGPPLILDVRHDPVIPESTEAVTIRAQIVDENPTWQTQVVLHYRDVSGERDHTLLQAAMFDDGLHNDGEAQDGVFATVLPPMPHATVVEFYIVAEDPSGQVRSWPAAASLEDGSTQQLANAIYQVDDAFYAGSQPVYRLIMTDLERAELETINRSSNAQMNATLITEEAGVLNLRYNVGVRIRGAGSRSRTPPNYRVNVPSDRPWNGVQELNLNTQYTHAQLLGSVLSLSSGLPAAHVRAIQVRVNGEKLARGGAPQFGSYVLTEVVNGDWAQNHYPLDGNGNTYACRRPNTDLSYLGTDPDRYLHTGYHKTSHASENDWQDLITLTEVLSHAPADTYVEQVLRVADVQEWMTYFAVLGLLAYGETALGTGVGDDYNMVRGVADPRFRLLPHDLDTVLGQGDGSSRPYNAELYGMERIPVLSRMMREPAFRALYHAELRRLMDTVFAADSFNPLVDRYLGDWVPADIIADIKHFVVDRTAYVSSVLPPGAVEVRATVAGEPPARTFLTHATLTVGGDGITHYRYRLNGGDDSPERPVSEHIDLHGLSEGTYTVYVWGQHADGPWQDDAMPTPSRTWTVTSTLSRLVINEVLVKNDAAVSYGGRYVDLIELHNAGDAGVDLAEMSLSDDPDDPRRYVFPSGTVLEAGAYLSVAADDPDGSAGLYTGFSLDRDGEGVYLYAPDGRLLDAVVFGPQLEDWSIGRLANGHWGLTYPTFGSRNQPTETGSVAALKINEWLAAGDDAHPDDFVEVHNSQPFPADLGGLVLTDNPIGVPTSHRITPLSFVAAGGFVTFIADGRPERGALHVDFKLAAEQGMIGLLTEDEAWIDTITYGPQQPGISQGRTPDGSVNIQMQMEPTPGQESTTVAEL
jgi:hypothetical protein